MTRSVLLKHLTQLLTPLARLFVIRGIKYGEACEALKQAFIDIAKEALMLNKEKITISKISVVTGLHRPDVKKLISTKAEEKASDYLQKIIWKWQQDKKYLNPDGTTKELNAKGGESEFAELVRSISTALNPYTVLFELERSKQIKKEANNVSLVSSIYSPVDNDLKLDYLTSDLNDLIQTADHNIFKTEEQANHHITTEYDEISENHREEVSKWLMNEGNLFHKKLRNYLSCLDAEGQANKSSNKIRVVFGSFSRTEVVTNKEKE